jgi:hypothetical protein
MNEDDLSCPSCGTTLTRKYSFRIGSSFQPHYNPSVGRYVRNEADFQSALSAASDAASEYTGIPHHFVAHDLQDTAAHGLSSADVAEANDRNARMRFDNS